jgi:hypothetical protein
MSMNIIYLFLNNFWKWCQTRFSIRFYLFAKLASWLSQNYEYESQNYTIFQSPSIFTEPCTPFIICIKMKSMFQWGLEGRHGSFTNDGSRVAPKKIFFLKIWWFQFSLDLKHIFMSHFLRNLWHNFKAAHFRSAQRSLDWCCLFYIHGRESQQELTSFDLKSTSFPNDVIYRLIIQHTYTDWVPDGFKSFYLDELESSNGPDITLTTNHGLTETTKDWG